MNFNLFGLIFIVAVVRVDCECQLANCACVGMESLVRDCFKAEKQGQAAM